MSSTPLITHATGEGGAEKVDLELAGKYVKPKLLQVCVC